MRNIRQVILNNSTEKKLAFKRYETKRELAYFINAEFDFEKYQWLSGDVPIPLASFTMV